MRLSLLFSLFLGLLALLTISKRLPFDSVTVNPPAAESPAQQFDAKVSTRAAAARVSTIQPRQNNQPLMVAGLAEAALPPAGSAPKNTAQLQGHMYKWRDSSGSIRYQSDPPPSNVQAQVIPFTRKAAKDRDDGQGQALVVSATSPGLSAARPLGAETDLKGALSGALSVYTPEGFDALIQRVEEIAVKLHERNQSILSLEKQL